MSCLDAVHCTLGHAIYRINKSGLIIGSGVFRLFLQYQIAIVLDCCTKLARTGFYPTMP